MMSWTRQVLHVFSYDVRATWVVLVSYTALLMLGVLQSRGLFTQTPDTGNVAVVALYGLTVLLSVLLVLRHPPAAPTSHWNSLPYSPTAVWTAKWLTLVLVALALALALFVVSENLTLPRAWTVEYVAVRTLLLCGLLVVSVLVAAVQQDLRSVLITLTALPIAMTMVAFAATLLPAPMERLTETLAKRIGTVPVVSVGVLLGVCAGLLLYRTQRVSPLVRWVALSGCLLLLFSMINTMESHVTQSWYERSRGIQISDAPERVAGVQLSGTLVPLADTTAFNNLRLSRAQLRLRIANAPTDLRSEWVFSEVAVATDSGKLVRLNIGSTGGVLFTPPLPISPTSRWQVAASAALDAPGDEPVQVGDGWHIAVPPVASGAPREVHGAVQFREPRILGRLPVAAGARMNTRGVQLSLLEIGDHTLQCVPPRRQPRCSDYINGTLLRISLRSLMSRPEHLSYALVNAERGEAVQLTWRSQPVSDGARQQQLLAPSPVAVETGVLLPAYHGAQRTGSAPLPLDERWLQGAELVVVEWVRVGEVPATFRGAARGGSF